MSGGGGGGGGGWGSQMGTVIQENIGGPALPCGGIWGIGGDATPTNILSFNSYLCLHPSHPPLPQ